MWDWERWAYVHHHSRSLILSSRVLHLCFSRQGIRLIKRMCPAADNMHIQGVFKCTQAEMTPLASYSEACLKESCGRVSVYVVPPSWDDKYHANPIRSAKCSACSVTKLFFFVSSKHLTLFARICFCSTCIRGGPEIKTDKWGVAESWNHMVEKQVTPGEVVWCTAGCLEGVELHHMSAWQLSQQLTSTTSTTWILWPFKKPFKLDA